VWFIPTKKEIKIELKKIADSFKKRDVEILKSNEDIKELKNELVSKKEIDLMIREAVLKVQSAQYSEPKSELIKEKHFDKVMLKKAVKNRPELIKQGIRGLLERGYTTTQIFNVIVKEKKLCGKTQFYHYLSLVKNEVRPELRPELRTKLKSK